MSTPVSDLTAIDSRIQELEALVAQLEHSKRQLKQQRNAAIPISRIPPELLINIFLLSLTLFSHLDLAEISQGAGMGRASADDQALHAKRIMINEALRRPQIISLCHVSHSWRKLAFSCPALWNHIQVQLRTPPGMFELMWINAAQSPIKLDLSSGPTVAFRRGEDPPILLVLKDLVKNHIRRFKCIGIFCRAATMVRALEGLADGLEDLVVVAGTMDQRVVAGPKFLEGSAPNLRRLDMTGVFIPWESPIFRSCPQLVHLALTLTPVPTPTSIADLVVTLRHIKGLRVLKLNIPFYDGDDEVEHFLSFIADPTLIHLADLEILHLDCSQRGPMGAILSLLDIPKSITQLILSCADQDGDSVERLLRFARCGRTAVEFIAPEEVLFDYGSAICWRKRRLQLVQEGVASVVDHSPPNIHMHASVWQEITVSSRQGGVPVNFTIQTPPWSFANLREVSVVCSDVSADLWRRLASCPMLEVVQVTGSCQRGFIAALWEDTGSAGCKSSSQGLTGMAETTGRPSLFPALQAVNFARYYWNIDPAARMGNSVDDANRTFLQDVARALSRWGGIVKELKFEFCKHLVLERELLDELSSSTNRVVWDGRVYLQEREE